jgi:hypothetical protein
MYFVQNPREKLTANTKQIDPLVNTHRQPDALTDRLRSQEEHTDGHPTCLYILSDCILAHLLTVCVPFLLCVLPFCLTVCLARLCV